MKDLFSRQSGDYAKYRPQYPAALLDYILSFVPYRRLAWDCGTGNGQTASMLSRYFDRVVGTDISRSQLNQAFPGHNILYRVEPESQCHIADGMVDLITVSQAAHWFDLEGFYAEVQRVAAPDAVLAIWGYRIPETDAITNRAIQHLYQDVLGPYWDDARKHIDEGYANLYFPFKEEPDPCFYMDSEWTLSQLEGFLYTWSALQQYKLHSAHDPVREMIRGLENSWPPGEKRLVRFPLFLKLARINS